MGHLYALAGPSGAGKTTFLNGLRESEPERLRMLVRTTDRKKRPNEIDGREYFFWDRPTFLQHVMENNLLHVEQYGDHLFGIPTSEVEVALDGDDDGVIMAGIYGATRLKALYGGKLSILYLFPGDKRTLKKGSKLFDLQEQLVELERRLHHRATESQLEIDARMELNRLDIAFTHSRICNGEDVFVLENPRGEVKSQIQYPLKRFHQIREAIDTLRRLGDT